MSVAVAVRDREAGPVILAADTLASNNSYKWDIMGDQRSKLARIGMFVVAFVGSFRTHDVLVAASNVWSDTPNPGEDLYGHLVRVTIPMLRVALKDGGVLVADKGVESTADTSLLLVAHLDQVCKVQSNLAVMNVGHYTAIGSGWQYAMGSLFTSSSLHLSAEEMARLAVTASIEHHPHVGGRVEILKTAVGLRKKVAMKEKKVTVL